VNSSLTLSIVKDTQGFYNLQEEWNELLQHSASNDIFLRWEWLYNWWLVYGGGLNQLCIIVVRENNSLLGIAPLYIKHRYLRFFRKVRFLGSNIVCSDYLDFILLKHREYEALFSILSWLEKNHHCWDLLKLTDIPSKSDNVPLIESFFKDNRVKINRNYTVCPYIKLTSTWEATYDSYASILKNTIKRKLKKFERIPNSSFEELSSDGDFDRYFSEFVHLNKLSLKLKNIRSPFFDTDFLAFHKNVINELYRKGMAKLCFLKADDTPIAGIYLLQYLDKVYYYQSGYDPAWEKLSPGTLLFHYCIKTAYEDGAKEFDFLQGDEAYKSSWTKAKRINASIEVYNDNFKGFFLYLVKYSKDASKRIISLVRKRIFEKSKYE